MGAARVPGNNEVDTALIYGDYYFTEALLRLQSVLKGQPGWALYSASPISEEIGSMDRSAAPEPSTWAMMMLGFACLGYASWRNVSKARLTAA